MYSSTIFLCLDIDIIAISLRISWIEEDLNYSRSSILTATLAFEWWPCLQMAAHTRPYAPLPITTSKLYALARDGQFESLVCPLKQPSI